MLLLFLNKLVANVLIFISIETNVKIIKEQKLLKKLIYLINNQEFHSLDIKLHSFFFFIFEYK